MGFTKLDERILQSSIMAESPTTFKVWIALLAACRENGIAYVSAVYLSSICHLPIGKVEDAIRKLESPDEHSRSLADEGRRIRRVEGGYEIINYTAYRDVSLKDAEAERKRIYRQRHRECPDKMGHCPDASASASSSASVIILNLQGWVWEGVSDEDKAGWRSAYPACDIERELRAMIEWAKANPAKAHKKNYRRFITNWLARSQERGGGMRSVSPRDAEVQRERMVGRPLEKTPEQKAAAREEDLRVKEFMRQMEAKWDHQIEAAKTPEERKKLRDAANSETQAGIKKIHGYEARP
jgi:hypothetical protein